MVEKGPVDRRGPGDRGGSVGTSCLDIIWSQQYKPDSNSDSLRWKGFSPNPMSITVGVSTNYDVGLQYNSSTHGGFVQVTRK